MSTRLCLTLAGRIDTALQRELGQGIDLSRMLSDSLYRRDVLLVCEASGEIELVTLGREFRQAKALATAHDASRSRHPEEHAEARESGFSPSRFFNSLFGALGWPNDRPPPDSNRQGTGRSRDK